MLLAGDAPSREDIDVVTRLIGRVPQGEFRIVLRSADGEPVVLMNAPLLADGTPMPTLYWLVGSTEVSAVSTLEAEGAIDAIESSIGLDAIGGIHTRYANVRDALIPADHTGPRPSGGVGGTRTGVKCLHAHLANWLAGNDDAVGRWVAEELSRRGAVITERR